MNEIMIQVISFAAQAMLMRLRELGVIYIIDENINDWAPHVELMQSAGIKPRTYLSYLLSLELFGILVFDQDKAMIRQGPTFHVCMAHLDSFMAKIDVLAATSKLVNAEQLQDLIKEMMPKEGKHTIEDLLEDFGGGEVN